MENKLDNRVQTGETLQALRIEPSRRARHRGRLRRWARWGVALVIVILAGYFFLRSGMGPGGVEVETARPTPPDPKAPDVVLSASGYVVAKHRINVNSKVTGRIAWIGVEKGDVVKAGQLLVRLEDEEFRAQVDQAEGAVRSAKARLELLRNGNRPQEIAEAAHRAEQAKAERDIARTTRDRFFTLTNSGVVSKQELDDAQARLDAAEQQYRALSQAAEVVRIGARAEDVARAEGDLREAEGRLAWAKTQLDATLIKAPVSGTILQRVVEKGELVTAQFASGAEGGPQGSVAALADLDELQVELDINQNDFGRLSLKQSATVTADAFPDRAYDGFIEEISPEANRQKATVQVKVRIRNPDGRLRPDMNAKVDFVAGASQAVPAGSRAVLVPESALLPEDGKTFVLLFSADGKARRKEVRLLGRRARGALVEGVESSDRVILHPPEDLGDGAAVRHKGAH
ncbi:MAG: efflux RND transporter periplasmic adaptor subunit [Acidobacteria bacterium]|nr:efflux RND transporter periplasmic adaptor subunit [Acidobacteriota bacterium]